MNRASKQCLLVLLLFCCSCSILKPRYITQVQHDTLIQYKNNTTFLHDSIYVWKDHIIYQKGDTVYDKTIEYKDKWKIKEVHDTLYKEKAVYVDKEVTVEVEKKLSVFQKILLIFGKLFIGLVLVASGYFIVKKFVLKM